MAIPDLAVISLCIITLALIIASLNLAKAIAAPFNINIPGVGHPFKFVADALNTTLISWLTSAQKGTEKVTAAFFNDLLGSLELFGALAILLGDGVKVALEYLWNNSLPAFVLHEITTAIAKIPKVVDDIASLSTKVETAVEKKFADTIATIRTDAKEAKAAATAAAASAATAVEKAAGTVINRIENTVTNPTTYVANTVTEIVPGLADALTQAGAEVAELPGLAIPKIEDLLNGQDLATIAGLAAAIPLLRAIVNTVAVESGLENAECRSKVKGICGTNLSAWEGLLGGLVAIGAGFSLAELAVVANEVTVELGGVVAELA
jgi:hypothetical protein